MNYEFPLKPPLMADFPACHVCKTPESVGYVANQLVKHHPNRPSHCSVSPGPEGDYPESMRHKCGERLPEFTKEERGRQRGIPIWNGQSYAGWWFGTWILCSHILGIISPTGPTDFHIFQRGGSTTNQLCLICIEFGKSSWKWAKLSTWFLGHWLGQVFGSLDSNLGNENITMNYELNIWGTQYIQ